MSQDFEGVENDLSAIVEAMRRLIEAGSLEDAALIKAHGCWPDRLNGPTASPASSAVIRPLGFACQRLLGDLIKHLGSLIGETAASDQYAALVAEQRASPDMQASLEKIEQGSGKPHPLTPTSIH